MSPRVTKTCETCLSASMIGYWTGKLWFNFLKISFRSKDGFSEDQLTLPPRNLEKESDQTQDWLNSFQASSMSPFNQFEVRSKLIGSFRETNHWINVWCFEKELSRNSTKKKMEREDEREGKIEREGGGGEKEKIIITLIARMLRKCLQGRFCGHGNGWAFQKHFFKYA